MKKIRKTPYVFMEKIIVSYKKARLKKKLLHLSLEGRKKSKRKKEKEMIV